ncbi:hypothetical protein PENTCL1PPCAC_15045, partial [Pristionchus entomophagus]
KKFFSLKLQIVLLCVLTSSFLQDGFEFMRGMKSALYSMFFIKNYQPLPTEEDDYFQQLEHANDFFTHYWSLCVEIQFYILAPFVVHLCKVNVRIKMVSVPQYAFDSTLARYFFHI